MAKRKAKAARPDRVPRAPRTLRDAKRYSSWALNAVAIGEIGVPVAHVITGLLREFRTATEKVELGNQVAQLRAEIAALRARKREGRA